MAKSRFPQRQAQAAATREQLLAAAETVFAERGYQRTTVAAITSAADTAHGTFYLHFKNKEDVFVSLVERDMRDIYEKPFALPGELDIERVARRFLDVFVQHGPIWRCVVSGSLASPVIAERWAKLRVAFVARIEEHVLRLQEAGALPGADPTVAANFVASMVEWGATTQFVLDLPPVAGSSIDDTAATIAAIWRGMSTPLPE